MKNFFNILISIALGQTVFSQTVNFSINTSLHRNTISPLIYGINHTNDFPVYNSPENYGSIRLGGNRLTGYNWENNASNAGEDFFNSNDDYLCSQFNLTPLQCNTPGNVLTRFRQRAGSTYTLATLPLAGYVAADKNGPVESSETAPSPRWKQIRHIKGSAFTLAPDPTDAYVYSDECMNYLVNSLGTAASGGINAYNLDNEPGLWSNVTHPRLHPAPAEAQEIATNSIALSSAIKSIDPSAETYGGVFYGFSDYYNLQNAPDWPGLAGSYGWYMDYFLDRFRNASASFGSRLLNVLDVHWYPEAIGDQRIINAAANSANDRQARIQAPRTLWDPNYSENSWIANFFSSYLPLLPRIQSSIDQYFPGTKLGISEYNYGGGGDISGGIAQADVLGIFGKYGVYSAQFWALNSDVTYVRAAFRLFRNYNGTGGRFGNTSVHATTSDSVNTSIYASISGDNDSTLHLVLINKSASPINSFISLNESYTTSEAWRLDGNSPGIHQVQAGSLSNNRLDYVAPPLSISHIILRKTVVLPIVFTQINVEVLPSAHRIKWQTEMEQGIKEFAVQRSCDGNTWSTLGSVASSLANSYEFAANSQYNCAGSRVLYRIGAVHWDGTSILSPVVHATTKPGFSEVFPNPFGAFLHLTGLDRRGSELRLIDATGRVVLKMSVINETQKVIDTRSFGRGIYWLEVKSKEGIYISRQLYKSQ